MQTLPNSDCWKWNILNFSCIYGSQNRVAFNFGKETLNEVSGNAKREANYGKPKQFLYNAFAFHKISQSMNCCYFKIFCCYLSNSNPKATLLGYSFTCKKMYNYLPLSVPLSINEGHFLGQTDSLIQ